MSSTPNRSRCVSEAPGPGPLTPPSPVLSAKQSWTRALGMGIIPILLDPTLVCSPSNETLPTSDSLSSLFPPQSVAGSVGTFGQPVRRDVQHPGDLNIQVSARINAWRSVDSDESLNSQSFVVPHNVFHAPSVTDFYPTVDPGISHSDDSTPTTPSFPLTEDEEEDLHRAEQESVFTLSAYLASASDYGDADGDNIITGDRTPHNTPLIAQLDSFKDPEYPSMVLYSVIDPEQAIDNQESPKKSSSASLFAAVRGTHPRRLPGIITLQPHSGLNFVDAEGRALTKGLKRKKSELDVPLTPTSTLLLSPSASISSQHGQSHTLALPPSSTYQQRHFRAVSAPFSLVNPSSSTAFDLHGVGNEDKVSKQLVRRTLQPSHGEKPSTMSHSYPETSPSHRRPRADADPKEIQPLGDRSSSTSSKETRGRPSTSSSDATVIPSTGAPGWIRNTSVELWIDQEGFRLIQPKLELTAYSGKTGTSLDGHALDVAEFAMKKRQTWYFHHATLDSPPVLRRLTVNGDMNDYISRQATLTLKYNGVYAVESTEDKGKLAWKFEYLVEDRWAPETGKIINGEKRFTPLRFVCNPELLTAEHGKKVRLLHFVRKSVTPKLQSFMLGPSATLAANRPRIAVAGPEKSEGSEETKGFMFPAPSHASSSEADKPQARSRSKSPVSASASVELPMAKPTSAPRQRPVTLQGNELGPSAIGHAQTSRPRPHVQRFSDGYATPLPPRPQTTSADIRPGQRIMSPSVLHAWFPTTMSAAQARS